ncbi:MAG: hypothetical protein PHW24_02775 [Candidatus Moranbacteria bacterium]|nr:hypothetical protein [Candidatus Moranbacteria bacterium]
MKNKNSPSETLFKKGFTKNKNISQGKKNRTPLVILFLVSFFLFIGSNNAKAYCDTTFHEEYSCECFNESTSLGLFPAGHDMSDMAEGQTIGFCSEDSCKQYCKFKYPKTTAVKYNGGTLGTSSIKNSSSAVIKAPTASEALKDLWDNVFVKAIKYLLIQIFTFCVWLSAIAATLFSWVIEPNNVSGANGLLNKTAVRDVWMMVRDTLNMTFILILLFAAFCTIFQIDKWNLKKVWLNILINALLVNFSFPIARFFIDVSNVAFYYFVNHLFSSTSTVTGSSIFSTFSSSSKLASLLAPEDYMSYDVAYLVAMIIVTFIMGMTILIVAALFIVRLVALAMLVMFSPVGFVGYIFPSTSGYADKWWTQLFSYSFFAPIMIFIMAISIRITEVMGKENFQSFTSNANANAPHGQADFIAQAAFFTIPIIIIWMGIGVAKSFGIAGADMVVNKVKAGGKWIANAPGKYSGIYGATKKATEDFNKKGKLFGKKIPLMGSESREAREAAMSSFVTGGVGGYKDARRNVEDKKIAEQMKEYKDRNYTSDQIAADLDPKKDKITRMAAMRALMADKGALGADPDRMVMALNIAGNDMALRNKIIDGADDFAGKDTFTAAKLNAVLSSATAGLGANDPTRKAIEGKIKSKVKKENVKKLIDYEISQGKTQADAYKDNLESLNAKDFAEQKGLHENIGTDAHLQNYIVNHVASDVGFHQEMFKNMKKGNRTNYINNGMHP